MSMLLYTSLALSAAALWVAYRMEARAIRDRISGANGLVLLAALSVSGFGSLVLALAICLFLSLSQALAVLAFSAIWHITVFIFTTRRLQSLIDRQKGA